MKESEIKQGRLVIITSIIATKNTHNICSEMKDMVSMLYQIQAISNTRYGLSAVINGYYWHAKDLSLVSPLSIKKCKTQHFNIEDLVT